MKFFPLDRIRLLPGPFADAIRIDLDYVMGLHPDRLLAPFLREAGLPAKAASYGNWEDSGLDGHTAGHYLSALALLWAATAESAPKARLDAMVAELARAQDALGTGYVGGVPGGAALFASLAGGVEAARRLGSSAHWVPWYNLHKTFQGLIDAHVIAGSNAALAVIVRLADWWLEIAADLDDETFEAMLDTEFGGMNDAFAQLAALTGCEDCAAMARRFSHRAILDPLLDRRDALTGLHANTQIPKAVGYATTAAVADDEALRGAADFFWRTVVERRTVAFGGNSVREHFHDAGDFTPVIEDREGPESCNTYNMLKLTRALAEAELRPEHLDFAERALFNHVLASQHPERGGFVYFTSMRPRHYRNYSARDLGFWCCVGTGMEVQAKHGEFVFGIEDDALAVNLFVPAELNAPEFGGRVRLETGFPFDDVVRLTLLLDAPHRFPLRLRVPGWGALVDVVINGESVVGEGTPGALLLDREWTPGDVVSFRVPLTPRAERLPNGSPWQAYLAGPIVLAARAGTDHLAGLMADDSRMGHIAQGALMGFGDLPIVADGATDIVETGRLTYRVPALDPPGATIDLEPFAHLHDARYTVYWPVADGEVAARRAGLVTQDEGVSLDARTIDKVALGEQQPESDHGFRGTATEVGLTGDRRWRSTRASMGVRLRREENPWCRLAVSYVTAGPGRVVVTVAGHVVGEETFDSAGEWLTGEYDVTEALHAHTGDTVDVEFSAADGLPTPGVATVRLLR
ncbi:MAG: glycoside hydrolase family 127 protein [Tessaracoccus sp.]|uniref:beta-L-arabinofuranosidase domain-containing protein n=1 Tax=Tessaracoccus sp. TaxID=1971211 RepID=UPI001EB4D220|nr:beta-L-arabinofuranosidase domain-containing protein [Tessaracoccus sp.]MBK7819979.1 glycoside hydrolase family 127 protein [Tessaracoccus sp.]